MKTALILGTTFATAFAHGPTADRRLAVWNGDNGATAGAAGASRCEFESISNLLSNKIHPVWTSGTKTLTSEAYHKSYVLVGHYDLTFEMTNEQWSAAKNNYKFYEWVKDAGATAQGGDASQGWEPDDLKTNGELTDSSTSDGAKFNKVVRFCYYKAPAAGVTALNTLADVCGDGGINLDVGTASSGTVHDSQIEGNRKAVTDPSNDPDPDNAASRTHTVTSTQTIYLEKYIGIASTCASGGLDNSGAVLEGLGHGNDDIFAWGKVYANQNFELSITEGRVETHSDDHSVTGISISAQIESSPATVNDFLYVSGEHDPGQTNLGASFPASRASVFSITYSTSWTGSLSASTTSTCTSVLTASAASSNQHCYSEVDTNPEGVAYDPAATDNGCTAKLESTCSIDDPTVVDTIAYASDNTHRMPEVGGDYLYTLGASTTVEHNAAIVVAVRQYSTRQYPLGLQPGSNGLTGTTGNASAAQIVGFYQTDHGAPTRGYSDTNVELGTSDFSCTLGGTGNTHCVDDPFYILGAVLGQDLDISCSFAQTGDWDGTTPHTDDDSNSVGSCTIEDPHDIPSYANGVAASLPDTGNAGTTELHIQLPPKDTPQFYVYGIATYQQAATAGTVTPVSGTGINDYSPTTENTGLRRLGAAKKVRKAFDQVTTSLDGAPVTQIIDQVHYAAQL